MSLSQAEEHGLVYILRRDGKPDMPVGYVREDDIRSALEKHVLKHISGFNGDKFLDYQAIGSRFFDLLRGSKLVTSKKTELAGTYYKYDPQLFTSFRANYLKDSAVHKTAAEIGDRYFGDVFAALQDQISSGSMTSNGQEVGEQPIPDFFADDDRKATFVAEANQQLQKVEGSDLSNSEKAQARGYLVAAKALADTPEPPVDLIWEIVNRANNVAGIASFFIALITLLAMAL